ncbi:hypothetical protein ACFLSZ_03125 [Candidatus Bipolaricaulota bacterium]
MRKQYHFRPTELGMLIWDVHRLVELSRGFPRIEVPLSEIRELDQTFWFDAEGNKPTCRQVALHAKLIDETELKHPVILSQDGSVMDGMHRVCKALIEGRETIQAVRFELDPEPDYTDISPDDLPY